MFHIFSSNRLRLKLLSMIYCRFSNKSRSCGAAADAWSQDGREYLLSSAATDAATAIAMAAAEDEVKQHCNQDDGYLHSGREVSAISDQRDWSSDFYAIEYTKDKHTLDQQQVLMDSVSKLDTFRGGTEFNLFNASTIILPNCYSKVMESLMFRAQTVKQFQENDQNYQDSMKDQYSGDKHKNQKSVKFEVEVDKVFEAYVKYWREHTKNASFQQGQEHNRQDCNLW
jgi:hypothetical protein